MNKIIQGKKLFKGVTSTLIFLGILLGLSTCILVLLKSPACVVFITFYASLAFVFLWVYLNTKGQLKLELNNETLCVTDEKSTIIKCNINDVTNIETISGRGFTLIILYFKDRDSFSFSARDLNETQIIEFQSWVKCRLG